jgi:UDP-N-acetylmuramate dehydrogenase
MIEVHTNISLKEYTTIHLGGAAAFFCRCRTVDELKEALSFARSKNLPAHVLGGGSNTIFADEGFNGLIMKVDLKGILSAVDGGDVLLRAGAGEQWEEFVRNTVANGFAGLECLSGIPGSVGATPIQNVGAYGQEVKDSIESVKVLDVKSLNELEFQNAECGFSYRTSRFKTVDAGRYIVTEVLFRLKKNGRPTIHYPEVKKIIDSTVDLSLLADGSQSLEAVRSIVLALRAKKSMVIDPSDPNTRSVGSFFLNPIVDDLLLEQIHDTWKRIGDGTTVPAFPFGQRKKVPAAWLIEKSGFTKGMKKNGVGISEHHTLALVNINGTTRALLALATEIQQRVKEVFHLHLELEANVIV